ncbi:MAG: hypothetical protein R3264_14435 [Anaerolineae bacterium]|nr:hypothetical protein [Anaerolineae bacterium]
MTNAQALELRPPRDDRGRLRAAVASTDSDLFQVNGRILVTGPAANGERVELGSVAEAALYQVGANPRALIGRVRFGPHWQKCGKNVVKNIGDHLSG